MEDEGRQLSFPQFETDASIFEDYVGMIHPQLTARLEA
jgi:hypothetical protein